MNPSNHLSGKHRGRVAGAHPQSQFKVVSGGGNITMKIKWQWRGWLINQILFLFHLLSFWLTYLQGRMQGPLLDNFEPPPQPWVQNLTERGSCLAKTIFFFAPPPENLVCAPVSSPMLSWIQVSRQEI